MRKNPILSDSVKALSLWRISLFLAVQDTKSRFRGSSFGVGWILVSLMIWVVGVGGVYGLMFGVSAREFLPNLMAGFVIWGVIASSLTESGLAFVGAQGYIKQFAFPKQIYILRSFFSYVFVFFIGIIALFFVMVFVSEIYPIGWLYALPGLFFLLITCLSYSSITAYLGARYRDLPHFLGGALQVMFLLTPIVFPASVLRDKGFSIVYEINPFFYLIEVVRSPLLTGEFATWENYMGAFLCAVIGWGFAALCAYKLDKRIVFLV